MTTDTTSTTNTTAAADSGSGDSGSADGGGISFEAMAQGLSFLREGVEIFIETATTPSMAESLGYSDIDLGALRDYLSGVLTTTIAMSALDILKKMRGSLVE